MEKEVESFKNEHIKNVVVFKVLQTLRDLRLRVKSLHVGYLS